LSVGFRSGADLRLLKRPTSALEAHDGYSANSLEWQVSGSALGSTSTCSRPEAVLRIAQFTATKQSLNERGDAVARKHEPGRPR